MSTRKDVLDKMAKMRAEGVRGAQFEPLPGSPGVEIGIVGGRLFLRKSEAQGTIGKADRGGAGEEPAQEV